jgi:hypothetical protein
LEPRWCLERAATPEVIVAVVRDGRDIEKAPTLDDRPADPLECIECGTLSTM